MNVLSFVKLISYFFRKVMVLVLDLEVVLAIVQEVEATQDLVPEAALGKSNCFGKIFCTKKKTIQV